LVLALSGAGLALSLWLEYLHVRAYQAPDASSFCAVGEKLDCTTVALSHWSVLLGLPLPLWGALGFLAIGVAAYLRSAWVVWLSLAAALGSVALLVLELVAIGSLCLLCEAVHLVSIALAVVAWRGRAGLVPLSDRDSAAVILLPPAGLMLGLLLFVPPYFRVFTWKGELPFPEGTTSDGSHWVGAREPKLTLEEYTDYLCPHCKAATNWTLQRLAKHPDTIRIVRRQHPLGTCTVTRRSSCDRLRLAYCASEQQRFWQADRWLFAHGQQLKLDIAAAAHETGLDFNKLTTCMERSDIRDRAARESAAAVKRRFVGTPTYFVNGKRVSTQTVQRLLERGTAE
jgi:uncharacterized membrane protein/predicted DsbA family dithiol-disulfide isomerase